MMNREESWRHLEESLGSLVASLSDNLDEEDQELLIDFIENREFGVALEWLCLSIGKHDFQLSEQQVTEIWRLAEFMKIDLSELQLELKK